jgi:sigma-B regulation protein RsbU (phosphoserine phosphatase)
MNIRHKSRHVAIVDDDKSTPIASQDRHDISNNPTIASLAKLTPASELSRAHALLDKEAREVSELQRAMLPVSTPLKSGLEIAASYEPSARAGGDLYDFFPLDDGQPDVPARWCVFISDTAGHGLPAAIIMGVVQAVLHSHPVRIARPATLLRHVNRQLCNKPFGVFVTAFLGVYEPAQRRFAYSNAGHPPPLLKRSSDGSVDALDDIGSCPLGVDDSESFDEGDVRLERDDAVLLYTDGITEARSVDDNQFDPERLMREFRDGKGCPGELIHHLRDAVRAHENGQRPRDDQTLVVARVL